MRWRWPHTAVALAILVPFLCCFGSVLSGARTFGYRDSVHWYYPLYAWIAARSSNGELPLWNPQQGIGAPVVSETTSALFYPGKLWFALPCGFALRYNLYVVSHVVMAMWGAYALARAWHTSRAAAGMCGLAYAFGGAVLFQYCNVVFLVGAAWLPIALLAAERAFSRASAVWALVLGVCLALMTLGGDPQAAYHTGLLTLLYATIRLRRRRRSASTDRSRVCGVQAVPEGPGWFRATSLLLIAAASGLLLASIQIVPAAAWARGSSRSVYSAPRNIYEVPDYLARQPASPTAAAADGHDRPSPWSGIAAGLFGTPPPNTHHELIYSFSVAPWRLAEALWPNSTGRPFPTNTRWLSAMGSEDRIWTPSLYLGLLPLLLGLSVWSVRDPASHIRWLSWTALLCLVGSFGWYGPGWIVRHLIQDSHATLGEPTGGVYWLAVVLLPGYAQFRFPAKLLVAASLALSVLAAIGFDRVLASDRARFRRTLAAVGGCSLAAGILVAASRGWWTAWLAGGRPDELFGPIDARGAWRDVLSSCLHTAAVCGAAWWLFRTDSRRASLTSVLLLLLTALELTRANAWMVLTVPATAMEGHGLISREPAPGDPVVRIYRPPERAWVPAEWRAAGSNDRVTETVQWDRATLYPHFHLQAPWGSVAAQGTLTPDDYQALLGVGDGRDPHPAALELLGTSYLVLPDGRRWPNARPLSARRSGDPAGARAWISDGAYPRAWVVHNVEQWPLTDSTDPAVARRLARQLLLPGGRRRDLRTSAVVESDPRHASPECSPPDPAAPPEVCQVTTERPGRLEVEVQLQSAGLVVLSQRYDIGWIAEARTGSSARRQIPIVRANRVMQGVFLPAGHHHLVVTFAPRALGWAAATSFVAWAATLIALAWHAWCGVRRRRSALRGDGRREPAEYR